VDAKFFETHFVFGGNDQDVFILAHSVEDARAVVKFAYGIIAFGESITEIAQFEVPYGANIINGIS
jgi:hypothetical protein